MRSIWHDTPICEKRIFSPVCPYCEASETIHVKSAATGDGSTLERVICGCCSRRYRIERIEQSLPGSGDHVFHFDDNHSIETN